MRKISLFIFLFISISSWSFSQTAVDTLEQLILTATSDTARISRIEKLLSQKGTDVSMKVKYAKQGMETSRKLNLIPEQSVMYRYLAEALHKSGATEEGLKKAEEGIEFCKKHNREEIVDLLFWAGFMNVQKGNTDAAEKYYLKCMERSEFYKNFNGLIVSNKGFGDVAWNRGETEKAADFYQKGLTAAQKDKNRVQEAVLWNNVGMVQSQNGDMESGLSSFLKAAEIAKEIDDKINLSGYLGNISDNYRNLKDYEKALDFALQGLKINEEANAKIYIPEACNDVAVAYYFLKNYDKSIEYFEKGAAAAEETDNKRELTYLYSNLGELYGMKGDFSKVKEYHEKSLNLAKSLDIAENIANSHFAFGSFYHDRKNYPSAIFHFKEAEKVAKSANNLPVLNGIYENMAITHAAQGDYKKAFEAQKLRLQTGDSIWNKNKNDAIARMQTEFETKEKEAEILTLEKEAQAAEIAQKKDLQIRYLLIGAAVLLGAFLFLFFNRSRALAAKNIKIESQRKLLADSLSEKEVLLKEIHHRVKNNLQIISGLLNLQTRQVTDDQTLETIREGQSRVQAMSLIHQNLYQSERLSKVDIEDYLRQLTKNLSAMFSPKDKDINISVEASNIEFDIDTAIPLGLIVNELVSNAYKYAFEGKETGAIKIALEKMSDLEYQLIVKDDGQGIPTDFDPKKSKSLGLRLVYILSKQLRGKVESSTDAGAIFKVNFKDIRAFHEAA